ncbi:hypothetical protein [Geothermobacter hydrogeniphilus]|uniref:Uncharacterized protein n=1 Tax=Geothermobacter hydrogeniphilus TaxID=1969733 RepID=A0A1X0Y8A9_9BACT|nr:hypothetical protein [Geothermobacter hydrogeniphilus]ORJ61357.1 hypothetical protein B5V00_06910 [Geothermobacter hydrogeniphilus]
MEKKTRKTGRYELEQEKLLNGSSPPECGTYTPPDSYNCQAIPGKAKNDNTFDENRKSTRSLNDYLFRPLEIRLDSGRRIVLRKLEQWLTYSGMLEGVPDYDERLPERERKRLEKAGGCPVVVVNSRPVPVPEDIQLPPATREKMVIPSGQKTLCTLGPVTCFARFRSNQPVHDDDCIFSELALLWFQQSYAMPIEPDILDKIKAVDWDAHARDLDFL